MSSSTSVTPREISILYLSCTIFAKIHLTFYNSALLSGHNIFGSDSPSATGTHTIPLALYFSTTATAAIPLVLCISAVSPPQYRWNFVAPLYYHHLNSYICNPSWNLIFIFGICNTTYLQMRMRNANVVEDIDLYNDTLVYDNVCTFCLTRKSSVLPITILFMLLHNIQ
jgi:hypothetical protein